MKLDKNIKPKVDADFLKEAMKEHEKAEKSGELRTLLKGRVFTIPHGALSKPEKNSESSE